MISKLLIENKNEELSVFLRDEIKKDIENQAGIKITIEKDELEVFSNDFFSVDFLLDERIIKKNREINHTGIRHKSSLDERSVDVFSFKRNNTDFDLSSRPEIFRVPDSENTIICNECLGMGQVGCSLCHRSGYIRCKSCMGSGEIRCTACNGRGDTGCFWCGGTGRKEEGSGENRRTVSCGSCGGSGRKNCTKCVGGRKTCSECAGTGKNTCHICGGSGHVDCSSCDAQGFFNDFLTVESNLEIFHKRNYIDKVPKRETSITKNLFSKVLDDAVLDIPDGVFDKNQTKILNDHLSKFKYDEKNQRPVKYRIEKNTQFDFSYKFYLGDTCYKLRVKDNGEFFVPQELFDDLLIDLKTNIVLDEKFEFVYNNRQLFEKEVPDLKETFEKIIKYRSIIKLFSEYHEYRKNNDWVNALKTAGEFKDYNDFKMPKIREKIAADYWVFIKNTFIRNIFVHIILAFLSFFAIYYSSKSFGAYPEILSLFHILLIPVGFTLWVFLFNVNIKQKIKEKIVNEFNFKNARITLFSKTILQSIFLLLFTIIILVFVYNQKDDIDNRIEFKKNTIEFEKFKSENPIIPLDLRRPGYIGGKMDSVIFIDVTDNVESSFFIKKGGSYYKYENYIYLDGSFHGRGSYGKAIADDRIYIEYSNLEYQKNRKSPDRRIKVKSFPFGNDIETYPRYIEHEYDEDNIEIVYMENDLESFINYTLKKDFIPRHQFKEIISKPSQ